MVARRNEVANVDEIDILVTGDGNFRNLNIRIRRNRRIVHVKYEIFRRRGINWRRNVLVGRPNFELEERILFSREYLTQIFAQAQAGTVRVVPRPRMALKIQNLKFERRRFYRQRKSEQGAASGEDDVNPNANRPAHVDEEAGGRHGQNRGNNRNQGCFIGFMRSLRSCFAGICRSRCCQSGDDKEPIQSTVETSSSLPRLSNPSSMMNKIELNSGSFQRIAPKNRSQKKRSQASSDRGNMPDIDDGEHHVNKTNRVDLDLPRKRDNVISSASVDCLADELKRTPKRSTSSGVIPITSDSLANTPCQEMNGFSLNGGLKIGGGTTCHSLPREIGHYNGENGGAMDHHQNGESGQVQNGYSKRCDGRQWSGIFTSEAR